MKDQHPSEPNIYVKTYYFSNTDRQTHICMLIEPTTIMIHAWMIKSFSGQEMYTIR